MWILTKLIPLPGIYTAVGLALLAPATTAAQAVPQQTVPQQTLTVGIDVINDPPCGITMTGNGNLAMRYVLTPGQVAQNEAGILTLSGDPQYTLTMTTTGPYGGWIPGHRITVNTGSTRAFNGFSSTVLQTDQDPDIVWPYGLYIAQMPSPTVQTYSQEYNPDDPGYMYRISFDDAGTNGEFGTKYDAWSNDGGSVAPATMTYRLCWAVRR